MGKFDKAMGAMDDEMLEDVNGGYMPNVQDLTNDEILAKYNDKGKEYQEHLARGWAELLPARIADDIDTLQNYEKIMNEKHISYISYLTA